MERGGLVHRTLAARADQPPHPALLLLHGRGSNELDLLAMAPELEPRFFLVSARAPYAWQGGFRWYEQDGPDRADDAAFLNSLALLVKLLEDLPEAYPIDPARLFLLGFSQGAMMSNAVTLTVPERVAGAVLLSGYQPDLARLDVRREALRGKPVFVAPGTYDALLPVELGRIVRDTLSGLGVDLTYREYPMDHQVILPELHDFKTWLGERLDQSSG